MVNEKSRRGFAGWDPEKHREICRKGGRAAHKKGTAHEWTSKSARDAGSLGGQAAAENRRREREDDNQKISR